MKFFRKYRFQSLTTQRVGKYLLYALGEIILVVVGILIALWINDIKTNQLYESNQTQLLKDVTAQLLKDQADLKTFKKNVEVRNTSFQYFSNVQNRTDSLSKTSFPLLYSIDLSKLNIDPVVISIIENFEFKRSDVSLKCTQILSDYKYAQANIDNLEKDIQELYNEYTTYLGENYEWFTDYSFDNHIVSESTDYFLNSLEYKKFIARINRISSKQYMLELEKYDQKMQKHFIDLRELLKG